ncbi:MAG: 4Fe-4S dicluster domain-containing protein [Elusimicrobiota bacterium]|jgi:ferredoxin|nr:4Fe-4S dicluster domain-containing protein [Elusimicrobiota bacterium]
MKINFDKTQPFMPAPTQGPGRKFIYNVLRGPLPPEESSRLCNRCGACAQACPVYKIQKREPASPRGRHQLLRFLLGRQFAAGTKKADILRPAQSCIMCGQCTAACSVLAPTAAHMAWLKYALGFCGGGFWRGLWSKIVYKFNKPAYTPPQGAQITAFYMPAAGGSAHYAASLRIIGKEHRGAEIMDEGLLLGRATLMQGAAAAAKILDKIKARYEALLCPQPPPIITDDIANYRALKLSTEIDEKYQNIAAAARFITDYMPPVKPPARTGAGRRIAVQDNNLLFCGDEIARRARELFICPRADFLLELNQSPGSAGLLAYGAQHADLQQLKRAFAAACAARRLETLIVFSSAEEKFFNMLFKSYYPYAKAVHITAAAEYFYEK